MPLYKYTYALVSIKKVRLGISFSLFDWGAWPLTPWLDWGHGPLPLDTALAKTYNTNADRFNIGCANRNVK